MPASPAVQAGVRMLKEDHENGARILATNAVRVLGDVVKELSVAPELSLSVAAFWDALCFAGFQLKAARPSMDAAIGGALIKALFAIRAAWKEDGLETVVDDLQPISKIGVSSLTKASMSAIDSEIQRRMGDRRMAMAFIDWLKRDVRYMSQVIRILTLSCSSSMKECLEIALKTLHGLRIELRIMESRPGCEGAFLASALSNAFNVEGDDGDMRGSTLSIQVEPDSSVAMLAKDVDIVLLGADRITSSGDVSNKMGSLAATICAKVLTPTARVLVVAETEKIAGPGSMYEHADEENDRVEVTQAWGQKFVEETRFPNEIMVRNAYFEWVPAKWIDEYISEIGILDKQSVMDTFLWAKKREEELFSKFMDQNSH